MSGPHAGQRRQPCATRRCGSAGSGPDRSRSRPRARSGGARSPASAPPGGRPEDEVDDDREREQQRRREDDPGGRHVAEQRVAGPRSGVAPGPPRRREPEHGHRHEEQAARRPTAGSPSRSPKVRAMASTISFMPPAPGVRPRRCASGPVPHPGRAAAGAPRPRPPPRRRRSPAAGASLLRRGDQRVADAAVEIRLEHRRVDVAASRDGGRVAQDVGRLADRLDDVLARLALGLARLERQQRTVREHGPGPRPEVLRRDVSARDLAQVRVDVLGADVADLAVLVDVLEQLLAGQLLAAPDDARQPPVPEVTSCITPLLPRNRNRIRAPVDPRVAVRAASSARTTG